MDGSFFIYGNDLLANPLLAASAGQLNVSGGAALFGAGQVVVLQVVDAADDGSFTDATTITGVTVYASHEDYLAATALYTYSGVATVSTDPTAMGDAYLGLDLSGLTSPGAGAPALSDVLIAPGADLTGQSDATTLPHQQDLDEAGPGVADGLFDLNAAELAYQGPSGVQYVIEGTSGDDEMGFDLEPDADGDRRDSNDAADGSNDDVFRAGAGNDTVFAGHGNDLIDAGHGNDSILAGEDDDTIYGGAGDDTIRADEGNDHIYGGHGNDSIEGFDGTDYIVGGDGDDWMNGDRGSDTMFGGAGNDWMRGSFGNEWMEGGTGNDFIWSGYGDDTIRLENDFGNDTIEMEGIDEVTGDVLDLTAITDDLVVDLTHGLEGWGSISDGTYTATFEDVENLLLGSGNDTVRLGDFSGADAVVGFRLPELNPDGTYRVYDRFDLSAMTDEGGEPLGDGDLRMQMADDGSAMLLFPKAESIVLVGVSPDQLSDPAMLEAMGLPSLAGTVPTSDGVIDGTAGADVIDVDYTGDGDGDRIDAGDGTGGAGPDDDLVEAGGGADQVSAGAGSDTVYGEAGDDTLLGGEGDDVLHGGAGLDSLVAGQGNDTLYGGDDADWLVGGGGYSWLYGGDGNDGFRVGDGDFALGEDGDDWFHIQYDSLAPDVEMTVIGGETGESVGDRLTIIGPATVTYDPVDPEAGMVVWDNGAVLHFSEIETIKRVPCFTSETRILTTRGERPAGQLKVGDLVMTRDDHFQPIRWVGQRRLTRQDQLTAPELRPVFIPAGTLGAGVPQRDLLVSPQHRMLISGPQVALWFGEDEVLVTAIQLTCLDGVVQRAAAPVTYIHLMFDRHQIVLSDGAWSESFQPGDLTLAGMDQAQRDELLALFPEVAVAEGYDAARPTLNSREVRVLFS